MVSIIVNYAMGFTCQGLGQPSQVEKGMRLSWDLVSVEGDGDETRSALGDKGGEGPKAGLWATSSPLQISESPAILSS